MYKCQMTKLTSFPTKIDQKSTPQKKNFVRPYKYMGFFKYTSVAKSRSLTAIGVSEQNKNFRNQKSIPPTSAFHTRVFQLTTLFLKNHFQKHKKVGKFNTFLSIKMNTTNENHNPPFTRNAFGSLLPCCQTKVALHTEDFQLTASF